MSTAARTRGPFRYAVIDLASATGLRALVAGQALAVAEPLFARDAARRLLDVGPWLVRLSKAPDVERALSDLGRGVPWGYFVHSTFDIVSLRLGLRRFNLAEVPGAERALLFRYWDPRVLTLFLQVATRDQRAQFFEWVERVEMADGSIHTADTAA